MHLRDVTDEVLLREGLVSLWSLEHEGPVMDSLGCLIFNEDVKLEIRHDWSLPFLMRCDDVHENVQVCHRCGGVRRPTFGPYLGRLKGDDDARLSRLPRLL